MNFRPITVLMYCLRALQIALIATRLRVCHSDVSSIEEKHHHSRLSQYTDLLCPFNVICREGHPILKPRMPNMQGCCTDCSCSKDCGLTENCCFPVLDNYRLVDRTRQECVITSTDKTAIVHSGYHMVVDSFPLGSGEDCGNEGTPCGKDEDATALGSLFPVFSKKTGRIYKNVKCAKCHGLDETDIVKWAVYIFCDPFHGLDASSVFQFFNENQTMDPSCHFNFVYPGPSLDISGEKCYPHVEESCAPDNEFPTPQGLNMTREEIRAGCNSTLKSPVYSNQCYKNVFCAICNAESFFKYRPLNVCPLQISVGEKSMAVFSALLDTSKVENIREWNPRDDELACKISKSNTNDCRPVHCPSGQVRLKDGQCGHPVKYWNVDGINIYLKLFPKQEVNISSIRNMDVDKSLAASPWPKFWRIVLLMYSNKQNIQNNVSIIDHFLVRLDYKENEISDVKRFMQNVEQSMNKEWKLYLNDSPIIYRQAFSEFAEFCHKANSVIPTPDRPLCPAPIENLTLPIFRYVYYHTTLTKRQVSITLTKMFFCEQIRLKPDEYEYGNSIKSLRLNATGRVFFSGEIAASYEANLGFVPRLCLSDSGFSRPSLSDSGTNGSRKNDLLNFVVCFLLRLVLH